MSRVLRIAAVVISAVASTSAFFAPVATAPPPLELTRPTHAGAFISVAGRQSAFFGYEHGGLEAWVYPLKIIEDLQLSFAIDGYPLEIPGASIAATIQVRPEATIIRYSHAAFTVTETLFAPIERPALVVQLDVDSVLPMKIVGTFRPRLRLMWPAGLMTANIGWDADRQMYLLTEESRRFAGAIAIRGGRDRSVMPYQEEPRDTPVRFEVDVPSTPNRPPTVVVIAGSVTGADAAIATAGRVAQDVAGEYARTSTHYRELEERTLQLETPDAAIDTAFRWARVGIDKGLATNPLLGTGLLAGFRTSGDSERPGFAWFFGRDALWTALAVIAYGDFDTARTALDFLARHQRDDGRIPHEVSQSASLVPWFTDYPYAWASADATPLYVIAHARLFAASGDTDTLRRNWPSIQRAWTFTRATDTDGNGLIENTAVGHGWVEGGALYPPHEEIYMQGLWVGASRAMAQLASALGDETLATTARDGAERTRRAMEDTYWLQDRGFYAFATRRPAASRQLAEPGPWRDRRQARLDGLASRQLVDEDTVLPAVPLWFHAADADRADLEIDRLGSGALATDWGQRLLSDRSELYDPLSYHYGSVWPLFTGWASLGAYRYGRPHVGWQGVRATAHLTWDGALGYITELLSGDFNAAFGRSSHHQIWSEAMLVTPLLQGTLGLEVDEAGRRVRFAPQLPASWNRVAVRRVRTAELSLDIVWERQAGSRRARITGATRSGATNSRLTMTLAPGFPLDARVGTVRVNGRQTPATTTRAGDLQFVEVSFDLTRDTDVEFIVSEGTEVEAPVPPAAAGARSEALRLLRARVVDDTLRLVVEGRGSATYDLLLRSPRAATAPEGATIVAREGGDRTLRVRVDGAPGDYHRRELALPLR